MQAHRPTVTPHRGILNSGRIRAHRALAILAVISAGAAAQAQVVAETVGERMARFFPSPEAKQSALPSFGLESPREAQGAVADGFPVRPEFSTDDEGRQVTTITIEPGTSLYGTGEVPGQLLRNGRRTITWNTDAYAYGYDSPSLYQSHPWVLAVRADGSAFGVLADTTYRTLVDKTQPGVIQFSAEGVEHPVYVLDGDSPQDVLRQLADLTGTIDMPPKWAIGYHQCRYSYEPDARVREIADGFRARGIPADVIWIDIDYMDAFKCFTFDPAKFPNPTALNEDLEAQGFKTVWMINPGIKAEPGYFVYDQGTAGDHWVKSADGTPYQGEVWPGMCVFPDYTREATRAWWQTLYADYMATGIDGVWNDMNEPAIFNVESKTMPEDNIHRADEDFGGQGTHARFHNVYGLLMVKSSREGIMAANPDKRPFVLSRANYIGGHRYAATWSGDNIASWEHLEWSVPMTLNLALSGNPFNGPDIGGFAGNGDAEMFSRWMGIGAMLPFARGHTGKGNIDKEPWSFGPEVEATARRAIERRYILMPYLYTLFYEAHTEGMPVARPMFFADPADPALRSEDDAFLLGSDLIVATQPGRVRDRVHAMPAGIWRPFDFGGDSRDPDLPGLFIRGGAILPTGPVVQHVGEKPLDPLTLIVCLDEEGRAEGTVYEDAGEGHGYKSGEYSLRTYVAEQAGREVVVRLADQQGNRATPARNLRVRLIMPDGWEYAGEGRDGAPIRIRVAE